MRHRTHGCRRPLASVREGQTGGWVAALVAAPQRAESVLSVGEVCLVQAGGMSFAHFYSPPMAAHGQLCAFVRSRPWAFWRAATAIAALVLAFICTSFGWTTELITHCLVHAVSSLGPKRSWGDSAVMRPSGSMVAGTPMWYLRLPPRLRPPPGVEAGLALPPGEVARRTAQIWPQRRVGRNPPAPGRACSPGCAFILEGSPRRRSGPPR